MGPSKMEDTHAQIMKADRIIDLTNNPEISGNRGLK
jgi:hypothetical protein